MRFHEAVASAFRNYDNFSGRAPRSEYWFFWLFTFLLQTVTGVLDVVLFPTFTQVLPLTTLAWVVVVLPSIAVAIRRLHDVDRTGWWLLLAFTIIGVFVLLYWACVRGTPGPNRFGPDPLERREA